MINSWNKKNNRDKNFISSSLRNTGISASSSITEQWSSIYRWVSLPLPPYSFFFLPKVSLLITAMAGCVLRSPGTDNVIKFLPRCTGKIIRSVFRLMSHCCGFTSRLSSYTRPHILTTEFDHLPVTYKKKDVIVCRENIDECFDIDQQNPSSEVESMGVL